MSRTVTDKILKYIKNQANFGKKNYSIIPQISTLQGNFQGKQQQQQQQQ
jgi:hypothetical protein